MNLRGASQVAPRWNVTNSEGQLVVPYRFHKNFPKKWREFVTISINLISSYIKQCIGFIDDTSERQYEENYIEITCADPDTNKYDQGSISLFPKKIYAFFSEHFC